MSSGTVRRTVEAVWRSESARIVGGLARYTGDLELAEDLAQEALAEALVSWSVDGVPHEPTAWLLTVGRRRAIDGFRRRASLDARYAELARNLDESVESELFDPERVDDDVLALMFVACHPVLGKEARIAVTLRVVGGLTSQEIARLFFVPVATVQARITRAKKALTTAGVAFEVPGAAQRRERLGSVLQVIYLIFTEGSSASEGEDWLRTELAREALRLGRVLSRLAPEPDVFGLLALMELTAARFPARLDSRRRPVLLEQQDRGLWDRAAIRRGLAALERARGERGLGPYGAQAEIAACHARASSVEETDWARIVAVYDALVRRTPSPIVALNRAVAVAMLSGPDAALALVEGIELPGSHLVPAVRGELLARSGRTGEARAEYLRAAQLCANAAQRAVLEEKADALDG